MDASANYFLGISDNVDFTLTFFDASVNYSICKADLRQKMWSERLAATRENTPPGVRVVRDRCRAGPSTRGATAPQRHSA